MKPLLPLFALVLGSGIVRGASVEAEVDASSPPQPPLFSENCSDCHGGDGRGSERGATLVNPGHFLTLSDADLAGIIEKGKGKMPSFPSSPEEMKVFIGYIRALNATGGGGPHVGDAAAGERLFFGAAQCATCHVAAGRGGSSGPNLSNVGLRLKDADLREALLNPSAVLTEGYATVTVELNDRSKLRGFARVVGSHEVVVQTDDGHLRPILDTEYRTLTFEKTSAMPAFKGTDAEQQDLLAFLGKLHGAGVGALTEPQAAVTPAEIDAIKHPKRGEWPTYNGNVNGNRHSELDQLNQRNVSRLQAQWSFSIPFAGLEVTPLVVDGIMYVTGNNQVYALSAKSGAQIWKFERPKSNPALLSSDARIGVNRGVAILGDRVFYCTDNAHMVALDRLTGAILWEVVMPDPQFPGLYGCTGAPLIVNDLVVAGVGGADDGIRGFLAAYKPTTGELAWRFWTIPKVGDTGPIADTWKGSALKTGGGSTWLTGSFDIEANVLYKQIGNPFPDTVGDDRLGNNLYTDCDLAMEPATGKLIWHYQYTPHDIHDWDCDQPLVLVDTKYRGQNRKLLLHANRNGFLYVLDRTTGQPLLATQMVDKLTWATGINQQTWKPDLLPGNEVTLEGVKTGPAVRGATNWYSTAWNPNTRLYYVMTVEDYTIFRKAVRGGFGKYVNPADPAQKVLRAFDIETGKVVWKIVMPGVAENNYSGVLSTATNLLFFGESSGGFAAVDARNGKYLWHFETHATPFKGSPMTYLIGKKQYVAIAAGSNILTFALPDNP
ncbi:MAG TPA: PQQ-binding-like beta-propeller repeat protein [Opitutaceae bacterium]|nr:PQQ-binding-like beta-propeller repeat protein [Opitutaceae bacterium]